MQAGDLCVEAATAADIPMLLDLQAQLFRVDSDASPDRSKQRQGLELLLAHPQSAVILVARSDRTIIGMVCAQKTLSLSEGASSIWIEHLLVRSTPATVVARCLLEAAVNWGRHQGGRRAQVLVDTDNTDLLAICNSTGWQSTRLSVRRRYF